MADNVAITAGTGTTIAADDVGGVLSQRVKVQWGPDGTVNDTDVASGKPLPVQLRSATGTAFDLGVGTGGSATLRVAVDSSQTDGSEYETVAASQTNQVMGATGAAGDYLSHVIVSPGTAACGVVTILDNATTIAAFPGGGTTALSNLIPFIIPIGITSTSGAWKITTGANVTCTAVGNFT